MRIEWHVDDVVPGRRAVKPGTREPVIIGFDPRRYGADEQRYAVVSLADGMLIRADATLQQVADYLNSNGYVPLELVDERTGQLRWRRSDA